MAKYGLTKKQAVGLYAIIAVVLYAVIFFVPITSETIPIQCFAPPCNDIVESKSLFDIFYPDGYGFNEQPCLDESCTVPEICIDGIYFGVCGGEPIFDLGEACYGLSTQECFDQCNFEGNTCRVEEPVACIEIFQPVCGVNGETFSNSCFAGVAGVDIAHDGMCMP